MNNKDFRINYYIVSKIVVKLNSIINKKFQNIILAKFEGRKIYLKYHSTIESKVGFLPDDCIVTSDYSVIDDIQKVETVFKSLHVVSRIKIIISHIDDIDSIRLMDYY